MSPGASYRGSPEAAARTKSVVAELGLKTALSAALLEGIKKRYKSLRAAADEADISFDRLYRLQRGDLQDVSIGWLITIAERTNVTIRIQVELV